MSIESIRSVGKCGLSSSRTLSFPTRKQYQKYWKNVSVCSAPLPLERPSTDYKGSAPGASSLSLTLMCCVRQGGTVVAWGTQLRTLCLLHSWTLSFKAGATDRIDRFSPRYLKLRMTGRSLYVQSYVLRKLGLCNWYEPFDLSIFSLFSEKSSG